MTDILLLAAGFGTRLRPLTNEIPKALVPIHGVPLLDIHIHRLVHGTEETPSNEVMGPDGHIVINTHHLAAQVETHVRHHPLAARLALSFEREILGTGGAMVAAADQLRSDPFVVLNTDSLFRAPLAEALAFHREHDHLATMIVTTQSLHPNVHATGGRVRAIDRTRTDPGAYTFTGTHIVSRRLLDTMPAGIFHDIRDTYDGLGREGRLGAFVVDGGDAPLIDVGTPAAYLEAHRRCTPATGLRYGVDRRLLAPTSSLLAGYGYVSPAARVAEGVRISDSVILGDAILDAGIEVTGSVVSAGTHVRSSARGVLITPRERRRIDDRGGHPSLARLR